MGAMYRLVVDRLEIKSSVLDRGRKITERLIPLGSALWLELRYQTCEVGSCFLESNTDIT